MCFTGGSGIYDERIAAMAEAVDGFEIEYETELEHVRLRVSACGVFESRALKYIVTYDELEAALKRRAKRERAGLAETVRRLLERALQAERR